MKKTLIALAAVAAVSASYAQVSMTGEFAYGFLSSTDASKNTVSGLGIDTAQIVLKAGEDLGQGSRIDVKMSLNTGDMGVGASSDDQSLTWTNSMGALSLLTYKSGDWVTGASGGATWYGLDGKVLGARSKRDAIAFTLPVTPSLSVTAAYLEQSNSLGEGAGTDGASGQSLYNVGVKYTAGPLVLQAAYLPYNAAGATDASYLNVTRLGGNYDLGVAKVGVGVQLAKLAGGTSNSQSALSLSAPLPGNWSVNGMYASNSTSSGSAYTAGLAGTRTGYMAGLQYNMSKRSYVILNTGSWTGADAATASNGTTANGAGVNQTNSSSMTALTMVHDF